MIYPNSTLAALAQQAHQMVYERKVLRALFQHIEAAVGASPVTHRELSWWEAILFVMPAWHTSPFSEYVTYFQFAVHKFPSHVRVFDNKQLGATEDEISPNYFMGNGLGVMKNCGLFEFTSMGQSARSAKHLDYCKGDGKKGDTCNLYKPGNHGGAPCPAPKYLSYHGFRNGIPEDTVKAYHAFDMQWLKENNYELPVPSSSSGTVSEAASSAKLAALEVKLRDAKATQDFDRQHIIAAEMKMISSAA